MVTPQQRGQTVVWYAETKLQTGVWGIAPDAKSIRLWFNKLLTIGSRN